MNKLQKLLRHIKNKTLVERIKNESIYNKRRVWIKFINGDKYHIIKKSKSWGKLKLYKDSILSEYIFFDKFELDEITFLTDFAKKGDIVLDVGSNIGIMGLVLSKKVGKDGLVYCFEPTTKIFLRLLENIKLNKSRNIIPIKKALSDKSGNFEFNTSDEIYDAWNSFAKPTSGSKFTKEIIEATTLDIFLSSIKNQEKISLIKIDVEGWEIPVLKGGIEFITNNTQTVFMLEFTEENANNAGYRARDIYTFMNNLGYNFYSLKQRTINKEPIRDYYPYQNLIAVRNLDVLYSRLKNWKFE